MKKSQTGLKVGEESTKLVPVPHYDPGERKRERRSEKDRKGRGD